MKIQPRSVVIFAALFLVSVFFTYAFWPRAIAVDMATVARSAMTVTINEEAKTRVHDAFIVSAPISGRLLRVDVEPGDHVVEGETIVAQIAPASPTALDIRTEEQAKASIASAKAALALAQADVKKTLADQAYAKANVERARRLWPEGAVSQANLEAAERGWRSALAALDMARANVSIREANLKNAEAMLLSYSTPNDGDDQLSQPNREVFSLYAPISGQVLHLFHESETILPAGASILEIGNPHTDLEIVAELLSTDAVKVTKGDRVIIEKWGGISPLDGVVKRVEPWGYTKFSALGVEEQRVKAIIGFARQDDLPQSLGHGYRAEVRIVIWEDQNALNIPASAVFRKDDDWFVYRVHRAKAQLTKVEIGNNNGTQAQITEGLSENDAVVLYPGNRVTNGTRVKPRGA